MKILAIETSCDDTGIAILEVKSSKVIKFKVLANIVSSQPIHKNYGGVFPMMAKREHQANLVPVLMQALKEAKLLKNKSTINLTAVRFMVSLKMAERILEKESHLYEAVKEFLEKYEKPKVDLIAVTHGPGLEPCLWVGVNFARALSYIWNIPIIPVNHIEAHILINFLENKKIEYPAISLVVSGGHTQLILVKGIGKYNIIGETRDDAAGECFDKCAKILGLDYPGGPVISKIASEFAGSDLAKNLRGQTSQKLKLPRPMMNSKDYDFSFSGLKTSVLYKIRDTQPEIVKSEKFIQEMCFEVQQSIIDVLIKKTINAAKSYKAKTIILGGGVSANQELRRQMAVKIQKEIPDSRFYIPDSKLSTDDGLMIAVTGYFHRTKKIAWQKLKANANLRIR